MKQPPLPSRYPWTRPAEAGAVAIVFLLAALLLGPEAICDPPDGAQADSVTTSTPDSLPPNGVVAIYFHQTNRCADCVLVETYVRDVLTVDFAHLLKSGRLHQQHINYELPANAKIAAAYGIEAPGLILSRRVDGKEVDRIALEEIWDLVEDPLQMTTYLTTEIDAFVHPE